MLLSKQKKISLVISTALGLLLVAFLKYTLSSNNPSIVPFDKERDSAFVLDMFNKNWYWLIENPEFSGTFYLDHMSPTRKPEDFGKENIRIMYVHGEPVGFVSYYKKSFYEGFLHFLLIDETYRGKGYAEKLMKYAIKELRAMNSQVIRLVTRVNNKPARKLYDKLGFKHYKTEEGFVYYELY